MGCGASKQSSVVQTTIAKDDRPREAKGNNAVNDTIFHAEKEILPGIKGKETKAAVCFEIPLENLVTESHNTLKNGSIGASRNSLPKVALSNEDIHNKLANAEERWKELESKKAQRKKGDRPVLSSSLKDDPEKLQKKLKEKETQAALNRQREKEKLAAKIAAQEERARQVLQRKKQLEDSDPDERLSVGGENDSSNSSSRESSDKESDSNRDSITNESVSESQGSSSRVGSSKSLETETTDVDDRESYQSSPEPIKHIIKKSVPVRQGNGVRVK